LWLVSAFDAKAKDCCRELGIDANFPDNGNRLPSVEEIRAARVSVVGLVGAA
jgi:hypothetical protein